MFDFGITGYEPRWLIGLDTLSIAHGDRLASLRGGTLRRCWIVWDHAADSWFAEQCLEPVDRLGEGVPSRVIDSKVTENADAPTSAGRARPCLP